jgi:hypothetical protein
MQRIDKIALALLVYGVVSIMIGEWIRRKGKYGREVDPGTNE